MNAIQRLIRADDTRITRFHTSNGYLCLSPAEFLRAFATTLNRIVFHRYSRAPWLAFSAIDYLKPHIPGARVFEFGSGMSTLWFAKACRQIVSVESDSRWHQTISEQSRHLPHVRIIHAISKQDYLAAISSAGGKFDVILVDGFYRGECLEAARSFLAPGGFLILDDTDKMPELAAAAKRLFHEGQIRAFRGWVYGNLHPHETTVVRDAPPQAV